MTREEKQKAIDALKISAPVMAVTQEEFNDYIQTLNQVMDWLEQESKWIPVSERLPEHYQNILFSTKTDRVFEGRYFKDETEHQWYSFRDECFAWNNVVTAWMPLPKPYEPQGSEEKE